MSARPPAPSDGAVRVLLVDDSLTVRAVLRRLLAGAADIQIVGEAANGHEGVAQAAKLEPDVVLMDVEMPGLDGWSAIEAITKARPTAVLVLSSRLDRDQQRFAFAALRSGALDVLPKPIDTVGWELLRDTLPATLRAMAQRGRVAARSGVPARVELDVPRRIGLRWIAIGASTGGPPALRELLDALPATLRVTVLVVQHIAADFELGLVEWLARELGRDVRLAVDGEAPGPGAIRFAPAGSHLRLGADGVLQLDHRTPALRGHRPSADELFLSCSRCTASQIAGVLLTGMGNDGAAGLLALRRAGALTLVQDAASSAIHGMPRAALDCGAAELALPPREIARYLARAVAQEVRP